MWDDGTMQWVLPFNGISLWKDEKNDGFGIEKETLGPKRSLSIVNPSWCSGDGFKVCASALDEMR